MSRSIELPRSTDAMPTVSAVVTSYQRPDRLAECLRGLNSQTRPAAEVLVVLHSSDVVSAEQVARLASAWPALRSATVDRHGSVAALNCGLAAARGEIVAIIDDDAVPSEDWLERITTTFARDEQIAAVGGRDLVVVDGEVIEGPRRRLGAWRRASPPVGRIQWFGRMVANHHIGAGAPRDVDVLKGANMSLRRAMVIGHGYDERLRGRGAIVHTELSVCLPLRRQGFRIVYDPSIVVRHYPAPRPHGDDRVEVRYESVLAAAHNETLEILDHVGPARRIVFLAWAVLVGTTEGPGLAVLARDSIKGRSGIWLRFRATGRGRASALRTRRTPRRVPSILASDAANSRHGTREP